MKTTVLLSLFIIALSSVSASAQSPDIEKKEIIRVIDDLFEAMLTADSSLVAHSFDPKAIMQTVAVDDSGRAQASSASLSTFLKSIAGSVPGDLREELSSYDVMIDGHLASVWTPYRFYYKDNFSHCGVNSFQLVKQMEDWKIVYIIDTRRREECAP